MSGDVQYETRSVHTVRGMEARAESKWQSEGWELIERTDAPLLRTKLTFRRAKKKAPVWVLVSAGAVAASLVAGILVGSLIGDDGAPAVAVTKPAEAATPATRPTATVSTSVASPTASASASRETTADGVTRKEVVSTFRAYFADRAAANVMVGKAVTKVTFKRGVLRVTFDPAAAGVSQKTFDQLNVFDNLGKFAATPIAFADDIGNRLRPEIDSIQTVRPDGESLGTYSRADILALNELTE